MSGEGWTDARPLLRSLHWLPVKHRVTYKMASLTFKTMSSATPAYLSDLIQTADPVRPLRSSDTPLLTVPRTRSERARRAFSVAASAPGTHYHLTLDPAVLSTLWNDTSIDPPVQTVLTWCHRCLCIFGLYGAIQILFYYLLLLQIFEGKRFVSRAITATKTSVAYPYWKISGSMTFQQSLPPDWVHDPDVADDTRQFHSLTASARGTPGHAGSGVWT